VRAMLVMTTESAAGDMADTPGSGCGRRAF
jgi:hypothetical protein